MGNGQSPESRSCCMCSRICPVRSATLSASRMPSSASPLQKLDVCVHPGFSELVKLLFLFVGEGVPFFLNGFPKFPHPGQPGSRFFFRRGGSPLQNRRLRDVFSAATPKPEKSTAVSIREPAKPAILIFRLFFPISASFFLSDFMKTRGLSSPPSHIVSPDVQAFFLPAIFHTSCPSWLHFKRIY